MCEVVEEFGEPSVWANAHEKRGEGVSIESGESRYSVRRRIGARGTPTSTAIPKERKKVAVAKNFMTRFTISLT